MIQRILNANNFKCKCGSVLKEPLVSIPGCSDDFTAIAALPDEWAPRHCGQTLRNFLKENEQVYETVIKDFKQETELINKDIDEKVRFIAEVLLSEIRHNQKDLECVTNNYELYENYLPNESRNEALKHIYKLSLKRIQDLERFKLEAFVLEKQRADGLRNAIKSNFQRFIAVGHKSPRDLLHDFDENIFEINQQLLSNCRAYIELEAQLRLQLSENEFHARSALNQLCLSKTKLLRHQSAFPWTRNTVAGSKIIPKIEDDRTFNLEKLKDCTSSLLNVYQDVITKLLTYYLHSLEDLYKNILNTNSTREQKNDVLFFNDIEVIAQILQPVTDILDKMMILSNTNLDINIQKYLNNLQKSLISLKDHLHEICCILFDAGHIWDYLETRFVLGKKLTLATLEDVQAVHDTTELANEVNMNIALEQISSASDIEKLNYQFNYANSLLDKATEILYQHREVEINKIQEFINLSSILVTLFISECSCYLDKYPKALIVSDRLTNFVSTESIEEITSICNSIVEGASKTWIYEEFLVNWRNNFLESFGDSVRKISERINCETQTFVEKNGLQVNVRYSLKLTSHSIREERLKAAHEARLAQLLMHEARLTSHLDAMYNLIDELPLEASEFLGLDSPELYPFCNWIKNIQSSVEILLQQEKIDPEVKRLKMMSYSQRLTRHRQLFEESLDSAIEEYKKQIKRKIQKARISNVGFLSQVKLFGEGGNYAASEALKTFTSLVKAADALETCAHRTIDALHHRRMQLLALADHQISSQRIDDVQKYGSKNVSDKKKPLNKKK
ncbi:unnamed protein product, partial [Brenthis ino]